MLVRVVFLCWYIVVDSVLVCGDVGFWITDINVVGEDVRYSWVMFMCSSSSI